MRLSAAQKRVVLLCLERGSIHIGADARQGTVNHLIGAGVLESFVPEATTWAMAARGRVRRYRLTPAGKEQAEKIKS